MRKFTSILCAMLLIASMGFAQELKKQLPLKTVQQSLVSSKPEVKKMAVEGIPERKAARKEALKEMVGKSTVSKSSKAAEEATAISIEDMAIENYSYDGYYEYMLMLTGPEVGGTDKYYIALDIFPNDKSWVNTFSTDDWTLGGYYYSAVNNMNTFSGEWIDESMGNSYITISKTSPEHYDIDAVFYTEKGNVYTAKGNVFYPDPKTYNMKGIKWQSLDYGTDLFGQMITTDNAIFQLDIYYGDWENELIPGKVYTMSDMDADYTGGYWNGEYIFFEDVTFVYNKEGADEVIEMTVYADNGDIYNISYRTPKMPETFNEINLTANAAELYDYTETDGLWEFLGVSEDGMWNISVTGIGDKLVGEYSEDLIYKDFTYIALSDLTFDITLDYGKIDNVKVVEGPEKGDYICTADFYCYNGNLYHVTLNHICPAIKQTVNLNATNLKIAYSDEDGFYIARASDSDYVFAVALEELKNSYAEDELIANEMRRSDNFIYSTYRTYPFTLTYDSNDVPTMKGGCITTDGTEFIFDLTYVLPKPTRNAKLELDVENSELRPNAEDGYFVISGTDSENDIELYLKLAIDEDIAGDYNIKDVDIVNSYIQENASSWSGSYFDIEDIDLNVSVLTGQVDGWDYAFVTGTILCVGEDDDQDIPLYSVVAAMRIKDGLVKDEENKDFVASYTLEDISTIDHSAEEGWILVQGKNVSGQAFAMVFFANSSDPEITIPEGVYEINDTQAEGTVVASSGLDESGWQATASYAANTNMLGFIEGNPWFMVGGNATVKNVEGELSVVVQAKNSYDRDVLIGINAELPTSIDSQSFEIAKPTKSLRDGNIVIERNGKSYNAAGLLIK